MNNTRKQYNRYLFKTNRQVILTLSVFLFFIFPLMAFIRFSKNLTFESITELFAIAGCVLAISLPLYFFRNVYWKRSNDTYLALPIKRKDLFKCTFQVSVLSYLIPLFIMYYLAIIICICDGNTGMNFLVYV